MFKSLFSVSLIVHGPLIRTSHENFECRTRNQRDMRARDIIADDMRDVLELCTLIISIILKNVLLLKYNYKDIFVIKNMLLTKNRNYKIVRLAVFRLRRTRTFSEPLGPYGATFQKHGSV